MENQFSRTELLIGSENVEKIKSLKVVIFGIGGVGGFTCEGLARAGVGYIAIVDNDKVDVTNINRQIIATHDTIGQNKVDVMKERILSINPNAEVTAYNQKIDEKISLEDFSNVDYVVDAVDDLRAKLMIIEWATAKNIPIISAMGTGNKLHPEMLEITDISKTEVCPMAKIIRKELRKKNINKLKVIYSKEQPIKKAGQTIIGSISFVPSVAGLMIAGEIIRNETIDKK